MNITFVQTSVRTSDTQTVSLPNAPASVASNANWIAAAARKSRTSSTEYRNGPIDACETMSNE